MITGTTLSLFYDYNPITGNFTHKTYRGPRSGGPGSIAGTKMSTGYISIKLPNGPSVLAHRLAWLWMTGEWPKEEIDHKNRDRLDNRWENLREATRSQQAQNGSKRSTNNSGVVGVSFDKSRGKWVARLTLNGVFIYQKRFGTFEEACVARKSAEERFFGEYAACH
jgi:hypothetical protein